MQAKGNNEPFGAISIAVLGDHGQLQPVLDCAVWSEKFLDFEDDEEENDSGDA